MENNYDLRQAVPAADYVTGRAWSLVELSRPLPMNVFRKLHWATAAAYTRDYRGAGRVLAKQARIPHLEACLVVVDQLVGAGPLPDPAAAFPAVKAMVDGLVDAKVLDDDTGRLVRFIGFNPPELRRNEPDRLILTILETHTP